MPSFSKGCGSIVAAAATIARCMSPGAWCCCGSPCGIRASWPRWRNWGATRPSGGSSASKRKRTFPELLEHLAVPGRAGPGAALLGVAADLRRDGPAAGGRPCRIWARIRRATPRPCTPAARRTRRPRRRRSPQGLPQPSGGTQGIHTTTTARSPRSSSGSATSCTCWWTPSTRWCWPTR